MIIIELAIVLVAAAIICAALDTYSTFACLKYSGLIERSPFGPGGATILRMELIIVAWVCILYGFIFSYVVMAVLGLIWLLASLNNFRKPVMAWMIPQKEVYASVGLEFKERERDKQ